ncbi:ANR family transcriptional regulator [Lelliottia sp. SL45]|uniref:ANR family transcriptional regulator n=1 Tax=Lelliottia sp. SL45 TaxID=2994665 RepID=UPI00227471BB|nr:ANR family transcriptional regulator [Lelliottia sp. SL45]MCY1700977.1 ANR family transcriptional regulator [Lelliottia sp. SL45]
MKKQTNSYHHNAQLAASYERKHQYCNAALHWKIAAQFAKGSNIKWCDDRLDMCTHISENVTPLALLLKKKQDEDNDLYRSSS